jgi:hypothetical protein
VWFDEQDHPRGFPRKSPSCEELPKHRGGQTGRHVFGANENSALIRGDKNNNAINVGVVKPRETR